MSFTYLGDLSTPLDQTRFLIGDTDPTNPLFVDSEVNGNLSVWLTPISAAIALATAQAAKYARKATMSVDGLSVNYSDLAKQFTALAQQLRKQMVEYPGGLGTPYVGGVSRADMESNAQDEDRVRPAFRRGQFDDPQRDDVGEDLTLGNWP